MFVAEYDGSGNVLWVDSAGGPVRSGGNGIAVDAAGNTYVTGTYDEGTATFGPFTLTSAGESDIFVAKYGPGACCLTDASCVELGPGDCDLAGGTYVGGVCDDDVDGDGIDGACPGFDDGADEDHDGMPDDCDGCPNDPAKTAPGVCDCGVPEEGDADGDGILDCVDQCPGVDDSVFAPECVGAIPTVSQWGLAAMALLLLVVGKIYYGRRVRA